MNESLDPGVAVVTGASQGIGQTIARRMAEAGYTVVPTARSAPALESVALEIRAAGEKAVACPADLRAEADAARLAQDARNAAPRLDAVAACAGVAGRNQTATRAEQVLSPNAGTSSHYRIWLRGEAWCAPLGAIDGAEFARGCRVHGCRPGRLIVLCWLSLVLGDLVKSEPVEIDGLLAGLTAAGPAFEDRLEQKDCLREGQAGRG